MINKIKSAHEEMLFKSVIKRKKGHGGCDFYYEPSHLETYRERTIRMLAYKTIAIEMGCRVENIIENESGQKLKYVLIRG